jgi:hypothetical protein
MGPFSVSSSGKSVQTAAGPDQLLTFKNPFTKLDVTNTVSFQTISVLLNHEPPQPTVGSPTTDTQIYQFKHGYTYIPAVWMNWQNPAPAYPPSPPSSGGTALTLYDFGDETAAYNIPGVGGSSALSLFAQQKYNDSGFVKVSNTAFYYLIVDQTYVTLWLRKTGTLVTAGNIIVPIYLIGTTANFRIYVFTEPATTSTY